MTVRIAIVSVAIALLGPLPALANPHSQDPAQVPAGEYVLDPHHASLLVKIPHMGFSNYTMRFDKLDGRFTYDPANWTATQVTITVDPTSINTGQSSFDKTIAGPEYFNAGKYPAITFVSHGVTGQDGEGTVSGDLTFHGVTRPVTLDVMFNGVGPGMLGVGTRLGFSGTAHIKRSDFGVTAVNQFTGDDLELVFETEFTKK